MLSNFELDFFSVSTFSVLQEINKFCFKTAAKAFISRVHFIEQAMDPTWTYFLFNVASATIYNLCTLMCSKSTAKCMFDSVIAMICSGKSHMDEKLGINTFYLDNLLIK